MPRKFTLALLFFVLLFVGFFVGLIAQQPMLTMSYLCIVPWAGIWLGRASVNALGRVRISVSTQKLT